MLDNLGARVNGDANLVRRGKFVTTTFLIAIDDAYHLIRITEGRIVSITPGPFITPNYSFALRASVIKAISKLLPSSLRLAAQDVALSRRKQGFESPRERHIS